MVEKLVMKELHQVQGLVRVARFDIDPKMPR